MRAEEISGDPLRFMGDREVKQVNSEVTLQMTTSSNDLSISELSLSDQTLKPFTLLATPEPELEVDTEEPVSQRHSAKAREEKLQSDIFILKKLNASFELFNEALQETGSANQVLIHNLHPSYR